MADISFYHLQNQSLEDSLPKLAERIVSMNAKAVIKVNDKTTAKLLDKALWTYSPESFLPHSVEGTKYPKDQILYITTKDDNPAEATMALMVNGAMIDDIEQYERVLYMFESKQDEVISQARNDYKQFKNAGHTVTYWQQKDQGGWEKKS